MLVENMTKKPNKLQTVFFSQKELFQLTQCDRRQILDAKAGQNIRAGQIAWNAE